MQGSIFGIYTPGECLIGDDDAAGAVSRVLPPPSHSVLCQLSPCSLVLCRLWHAEEILTKCLTNVKKAGTDLVRPCCRLCHCAPGTLLA